MFGTLYHPEYMNLVMSDGSRFISGEVKPEYLEIATLFSSVLNQAAKNNSNTARNVNLIED